MIDNSEDFNFISDPIVVEVYLNQNDYKDRLLIGHLKKKAHITKVPGYEENSFFVKADEMSDILIEEFQKDLISYEYIDVQGLGVNSIHLINGLIIQFQNIRYFRVHVFNLDKINTRGVKYKIMHAKIDLANIAHEELLNTCSRIFKEIGVYQNSPNHRIPYIEISFSDLSLRLQNYANRFNRDDKEYVAVEEIFSIFDKKIQEDNSTMMIIMEK